LSKISFYLFIIVTAAAGDTQSTGTPFSRGVNLSMWFQESSPQQIQFSKYTKKDFEQIKSLGCDVIRLPINLHAMTGGSPDYTIDPLFFYFLDEAVNWAEELDMHIIIDNHTFDPAVSTSPLIGNILVPVWKQMASHMKNRSALVYYEILNEPHGINEIAWNAIQKMVIDSIRSVDQFHTIVVGPANWNSYTSLAAMPAYADTNLIYTFHFYDPFIFTHQGASWASPSMVDLAGVPFPYNAATMPACPPSLAGTWIQNEMNAYASTGTAAHVKSLIDSAVNFKNKRNVRIFCGEFGVYIPNSNNDDRTAWYEIVRKYFEEKGIAWTSWDYQGGFGLFEKGTDEMFDYDLNIPLINALGLTAPPQSDFTVIPDSAGFDLYRDYFGPQIFQSSSTVSGSLNFYSSDSPADGNYCIRWADALQYESIGFDFKPTRDLSFLKNDAYVLDFRVRSSSPGLRFDVRFIDTKTGPSDHPWRMRKTITSSVAAWDGAWHQVRIPLTGFTEQGSWDGSWYNPVGAFDWKAVDRFEIVAEDNSLAGEEVSFDDIHIAPLSPAFAEQNSVVPKECKLLQNYPNPFNPNTTINYQLSTNSLVTITIYDMIGRETAVLVNEHQQAGTRSVEWNAANLPSGIYLCRMRAGNFVQTQKMLLLK
jgi:endoglucanase